MKNKSLVILPILLVSICILSLKLGSVSLSFSEFFGAFSGKEESETARIIIFNLRLPRMAGGVLCGVALAISGVLLQSITGNKMASPNLIGVNAGAGFAVIFTLSFLPLGISALPFVSFGGAFISTLIILAISSKMGLSKNTVVLVGIAFGAILNAGISMLSLLDTDVLVSYNSFSIGSLAGMEWSRIAMPFIIILLCTVISLILSPKINLLLLGNDLATSLGANVKALRVVCMILASALAGAAVSFVGLLGFVGLISPHIARLFVGDNLKKLLPCSAFCGGILVTLADLLGRVIFSPGEIPVGIIMALSGAPFFLFMLLKGGSKNA